MANATTLDIEDRDRRRKLPLAPGRSNLLLCACIPPRESSPTTDARRAFHPGEKSFMEKLGTDMQPTVDKYDFLILFGEDSDPDVSGTSLGGLELLVWSPRRGLNKTHQEI